MGDKIEFVVTGEARIHCSSCEQRIGNALRRVPGVENAWASALSQRIVVTIDPARTTSEQVRSRLEQIGYRVVPKEAKP